jgi:hypothetical protein
MNFECTVALILVVVVMAGINLVGMAMLARPIGQRLDEFGDILRGMQTTLRDGMVNLNNTMVAIHHFLESQERRGPAE